MNGSYSLTYALVKNEKCMFNLNYDKNKTFYEET